jgi:hypothetical protein
MKTLFRIAGVRERFDQRISRIQMKSLTSRTTYSVMTCEIYRTRADKICGMIIILGSECKCCQV